MSWAAVIGAGVSLVSGYMSNKKSKGQQQGGQQQQSNSYIEVNAMSPEQKTQFNTVLTQLVGNVGRTSPQFSRQQAVLDANYVAQKAADDVLKNIPQIVSTAASQGAYSSTGVQALVNDVAERATTVKAKALMDTIQEYAKMDMQQQQVNLSALLQAFNTASQSDRKEKRQGTDASSFSGQSSQSGGSSGMDQNSQKAIGTLVGGAFDFFSGRGGSGGSGGYNSTQGAFDSWGSGDVAD